VARAFLGLGSNLGDRRRQLREAVAAIPDVVAVSRVYETVPVGGPDDQGAYLNIVVALDTRATPRELLEICRAREAAARRVRTVRWGPRTLDVDVLWVDGQTVDEPDLTVPHPRMFERAFVLMPLRDVAPDLIPPDFVDPPLDEVRVLGPL
jgi:2-amino-4-hydroxy-6-hydroxymethyldihydropteridine diphosphokinase